MVVENKLKINKDKNLDEPNFNLYSTFKHASIWKQNLVPYIRSD